MASKVVRNGFALALCPGLLFAQLPEHWFAPILPEQTRRSQMYAFVNEHIPRLPKFASVRDWETYKARLRPRLLQLLGVDDILATHKLRTFHKGRLERRGYFIEKIVYESFPGMWAPALVWVPAGLTGQAPAMVSISGHLYCDSKAGDYVQARNYNLVRRGFIVVSYDYLGCFERGTADACAPGVWGGADHTNSLFSYTRRTPTGVELLDAIRAIDYLYSRPDVDRTRIGFTGESGGGNSAYWASALDDRVTLSAPVSSAGAFEQWIKADLNYDWHQRPTGVRAIADIGTLYAMAAPKPLLIINGHPELEEFALPDALRSVDYARDVYNLYGQPERIAFHESSTGHGYQADKRHQLYRWLDRWFFEGKAPGGDQDLPYQPESRETLRVGLPDGNLSIPALARKWVESELREIPLPRNVAAAKAFQSRKRRDLKVLVGRGATGPPNVIFTQGGDLASGDKQAVRLRFEVDRDLLLPGVLVRKHGSTKRKTIIIPGKENGTSPEAAALLEAGYALLLLDVRGTGEMDWGGGRTSNWSQFVGRPAIGMWAKDISGIAAWLLGRKDVDGVAVLGQGSFGKAALYAAALDERIAAAAIGADSLSYRQEAMSGLTHVFADIPRILTWGDTPQIASLVAPRPLVVLSAGLPASLNDEKPAYFSPLPRFAASQARVSEDELRSNFEWTERFYETMGAAGRFATGLADLSVEQRVVAWFRENF